MTPSLRASSLPRVMVPLGRTPRWLLCARQCEPAAQVGSPQTRVEEGRTRFESSPLGEAADQTLGNQYRTEKVGYLTLAGRLQF